MLQNFKYSVKSFVSKKTNKRLTENKKGLMSEDSFCFFMKKG